MISNDEEKILFYYVKNELEKKNHNIKKLAAAANMSIYETKTLLKLEKEGLI